MLHDSYIAPCSKSSTILDCYIACDFALCSIISSPYTPPVGSSNSSSFALSSFIFFEWAAFPWSHDQDLQPSLLFFYWSWQILTAGLFMRCMPSCSVKTFHVGLQIASSVMGGFPLYAYLAIPTDLIGKIGMTGLETYGQEI